MGLRLALLVLLLAPASGAAQFTPFRHDAKFLLEGNWQSCLDERTGQFAEKIFDQLQLGIEVHLGPGDEFALFRGIQDEHRDHRSPQNLLQPARVRGDRQRWELPDLIFEVAHAGGSRHDCRSFWITLEPTHRAPERDSGELAARLQQQYDEDPSSAIPLARQLGAMPDPRAQSIFVDWIHNHLARDFAPAIADRATTPAHAAFLAALADARNPDGPQATATAALRMWVAAQQTADPPRLRAFAARTFSSPASYGVRYQLLLANLLERQPQSALRATDDIVRQLVPAWFIVSPDGHFSRLEARTWEADARRILSLNQR